MARIDTIIAKLEESESNLVDLISAPSDVVEYEIGGRMVRRESKKTLEETLDGVRRQLAYYRAQRDGGRATNYARLSKRF